MTDACTELRVIAADGGKLSPADCALIGQVADEYEHTQKMLVLTQMALIEEQRAHIAAVERLLEIERKRLQEAAMAAPAKSWSLSSGWVRSPMRMTQWPV
jgi:hypothetical protein